MMISRRKALWAGFSGIAAATLANPLFAATVEELTAGFTGGAAPGTDGITLTAPEIAENGNVVPLTATVESPMTDEDYVKTLHIFSEGNPLPFVASYYFTPACGKAQISTRMRMATTQNVVAVAETSKGEVLMGKVEVKVTIGGCGG